MLEGVLVACTAQVSPGLKGSGVHDPTVFGVTGVGTPNRPAAQPCLHASNSPETLRHPGCDRYSRFWTALHVMGGVII